MLTSSVVICTYNGSKYFESQFRSILDQSLQPNQIIISDDASTDNTAEMIRSLVAEASQTHPLIDIRFLEQDRNVGVTENFASAIANCTQDIIFLSDQDDRWHRQKIARLLPIFMHQPQTLLVFHNANMTDASLHSMGYDLWSGIGFDSGEQTEFQSGLALQVLLKHSVIAGSCMAFRSSTIPMLLPMPKLRHCHDMWIALILTSLGHVQAINEPLIDYRLHGSNAVGMRRFSLMGQIQMARWQIKERLFRYGADLHSAALASVEKSHQLSQQKLSMVQKLFSEKINHFTFRDALPPGFFRLPMRLPVITSHFVKGYYRKYSYGYKSVLQDLFLR